MSDAVRQTIQILEMELEAIDQRRGDIAKAIESLRPLAGDEPRAKKARRLWPRGKPGRPKKHAPRKADGRTDGANRTPTAPRSRSLPDGTTAKTARHQEAILTALRAKSPQAPSELAKTLKLARPALTRQLKPLLKRGAVIATGATMNRQVSLGRARAAKEAP